MSDIEDQIQHLHERTESNRREFLRTELRTSSIAVEKARFELSVGNTHEAEKEFVIASRGIQVIEKFLREAPSEIPEIEPKLASLRASVQSLKSELDTHPH